MARRSRRPALLRQLRDLGVVVRLLGPYLREHRRALLGGAGLTVLLLVLRVAQPWPLKWVVDGLTSAGEPAVPVALAGSLFLVVSVAAAGAEYTQVLSLAGLGNRLLNAFRSDLFEHVLKQPLAFHERKGEGELLTRIVFDTTRLRKGLNYLLTRLLQTVLLFAAIIGVLLWVDAVLASVVAAAGASALWIMARNGERIRRAARKNRKREGRLASAVADDLTSIREIQTFRSDGRSGAFERLNAKALKQETKVQRLASGLLLRVEVLLSLAIAVVLPLGAYRVASGAITAGDLVLFVSYATALYQPFFRFARQSARMGTTVAAAERLRKLIERQPEVVDAPDAVDAGTLRGEVEFRSVGMRSPKRHRGARRWAVRGVSFHVAPGERVAVVGANGAGKSSLLRLLLRLSAPREGEIRIDGRDVRSYTVASLRREMRVVLQGSLLFGLSVRENLRLGRPDASDEDLLEAARRTGSLDLIQRLPDGLDTPIRRQGRLLSAGERQRLVLTRAFLRPGSLWLLDEPTTGLDDATAAALTDALIEATRGHTTFWITHDPRLPERLDRVLYLVDGRVGFFGTPDAFRFAVAAPLTAIST